MFLPLKSLRLLKDAVNLFEAGLTHNPDIVNAPFAKEIVLKLKTKLDDMLQMEDWEKRTPFDYNEVHILYAAVHLQLAYLKLTNQHELISRCITLCNYLTHMVQLAEMKVCHLEKEKEK